MSHIKRFLLFGIILLCVHAPGYAQKLGYALSGGGARGFAHIGVLKVLEEKGIKPDYITGSSSGAIIGALSAMGYTAKEIEAICVNIDWEYLTRDEHHRKDLYIGQKRWAPYGNSVFELNQAWVPQLPSSVFVGNRINLELFRLFAPASQVKDFNYLPIPFACNATDLISGKGETFRSGSLMQALRASMSIPSLVKPFEIDGKTYIDGGVSQNMPVDLLHELGADYIIGIKVNSSLRNTDNLNNLIEILDQTINIGMTRNLNEHLDDCDLLLEPVLQEFSATDYSKIADIIAAGEAYARERLAEEEAYLETLRNRMVSPANQNPHAEQFNRELSCFRISEVFVHGNVYVSAAKVEEYLGLKTGKTYSVNDLYTACYNAWNSQVFSTIYPVLKPIDDGTYQLHIHLKERDRKEIALNMSYNSDDKLSAGVVLSLNNYLLKNSKLLSELKLGGKNELNIDYVKNFGEQWGIYYRLFNYINEKTVYNYQDHHKVNSVRSLDFGMTSGIGVFARDLAIAELFLFSSSTRLYTQISPAPEIPVKSVVSGFGIKTYHESLDDFVFPVKGMAIYNKFSFSRNLEISDFIYSSYQGRGEAYLPLYSRLSLHAGINYGSYFNSELGDRLDPFVIGGSEGFMGYSRYEISAPHYQIVNFGLVSNIPKRWWFSLGTQALRYAESDVWGIQKDWEYCAYAGIGYRTKVLPVRLYIALNEAKNYNSLLSVGYDFDIFHFSRK